MATAKAQRTLVKSPPELWCELGDAAALERHLGDLGEIRITRCEPEQLLEWQAPKASGSIELKASGWGTKVLLSLTRDQEPPAQASTKQRPERAPEQEPEQPSQPQSNDPQPQTGPPADSAQLQDPLPAAQPAAEEPDWPAIAERRIGQRLRGMWARLRDSVRRTAARAELEPEQGIEAADLGQRADCERDAFVGLAEAALTQSVVPDRRSGAADGPVDTVDSPAEPAAQIGRSPTQGSGLDAPSDCGDEQAEAMLTGLLDRLGEAHHRPFSRA